MKKIQILGTGCAKCNKLTEATEAAARELGLDYELEKITDMMRFADFGVMITPALVVDGEVKASGKVPADDELKTMIADSAGTGGEKADPLTAIRTVGFIGSGRVARIILGGWKRAGKLPSRIVLFDPDPARADGLKSMGPEVESADAIAEAASQDAVFLAVHPPAMQEAAEAIRSSLRADAVVVSLAPKFTTGKLSDLLGGFDRIARVIPNAPSLIGRGFNPLAFTAALDEVEQQAVREILEPLGDCPEVAENQLEAYAVLSAMGPTYFWPQIESLSSLGEEFGLAREATAEALDKMLRGAMATIRESGLPPDQVRDLIPVQPMADEVRTLCESYDQKLKGLFAKISP